MSVRNMDVGRRIRRVFVRSLGLNLDAEDPAIPSDLSSFAGIGSLAVLEFVAGLEQEFGMVMEPEVFRIDFLSDLDALTGYFCDRLEKQTE
jgi:acyl carrier protein